MSNTPSRNLAVFEIIKQWGRMGIITLPRVFGIRNEATSTTELRKAEYLFPTLLKIGQRHVIFHYVFLPCFLPFKFNSAVYLNVLLTSINISNMHATHFTFALLRHIEVLLHQLILSCLLQL